MQTKIIATIGPSSFNPIIIKRMINAGMNIARINLKYASISDVIKLKSMTNQFGCELLVDVLNKKNASLVKQIDFDYLALSFAKSAEQINEVRSLFNHKINLISKIETRAGVKNINQIIKASNGVMVARGDLGSHVPIESLPFFQKSIINECNKKYRFVITATEMLLSMTKSRIPTKAEVSDVANAVIDGSDALMLSEETAIGKHPVLAVKTMAKIINEAELFIKSPSYCRKN
ncbi:MAG: pyruvate kinase [Candidatus Nanoarchaeia archaeon]|jgi:pyruvate kinase